MSYTFDMVEDTFHQKQRNLLVKGTSLEAMKEEQ